MESEWPHQGIKNNKRQRGCGGKRTFIHCWGNLSWHKYFGNQNRGLSMDVLHRSLWNYLSKVHEHRLVLCSLSHLDGIVRIKFCRGALSILEWETNTGQSSLTESNPGLSLGRWCGHNCSVAMVMLEKDTGIKRWEIIHRLDLNGRFSTHYKYTLLLPNHIIIGLI